TLGRPNVAAEQPVVFVKGEIIWVLVLRYLIQIGCGRRPKVHDVVWTTDQERLTGRRIVYYGVCATTGRWCRRCQDDPCAACRSIKVDLGTAKRLSGSTKGIEISTGNSKRTELRVGLHDTVSRIRSQETRKLVRLNSH